MLTTLELDGPDLEELLYALGTQDPPGSPGAELRAALLRQSRALPDRPDGRVTVVLDETERSVVLARLPTGHPLRPRVDDELARARAARAAARDRRDALTFHPEQRAAMEALDRAVRRALDLGLGRDVRQLVDDALADHSQS
jgi:hypothetical protein